MTCPLCNDTGEQRYWEGRWRDEKAENERLRAYQDETAKAWTKLTDSQEQEIAQLRAALAAYRQAQRFATGTEDHRLALQAADETNPVPHAYQQT